MLHYLDHVPEDIDEDHLEVLVLSVGGLEPVHLVVDLGGGAVHGEPDGVEDLDGDVDGEELVVFVLREEEEVLLVCVVLGFVLVEEGVELGVGEEVLKESEGLSAAEETLLFVDSPEAQEKVLAFLDEHLDLLLLFK